VSIPPNERQILERGGGTAFLKEKREKGCESSAFRTDISKLKGEGEGESLALLVGL